MANESGRNERRQPINFWDGTNAIVSKSVAKLQELLHTENARSKIIGTIEKREGQVVLGTNTVGGKFSARDNYGLSHVATGYPSVNGLYRLSGTGEPYTIRTISVADHLYVIDAPSAGGANTNVYIKTGDDVTLTEVPLYGVNDTNTKYINNTDYSDVNIYKLSEATSKWNKLSHTKANNLGAADFSSTAVDGKVFLVNGRNLNRYVDQDGTTVVDSTSGLGSLYNSPKAKIINSYKGRLYLANYDWQGIRYGTTVLVSSPPLGIAALVRGDVLVSDINVYASVNGGQIHMQTAETGTFDSLNPGYRVWTGMTTSSTGNVYAAVDAGDIYMQTAGVGPFVALGQTSRAWRGMAATANGNVYAAVDAGDIYMQTAGTGSFSALGGTSRAWTGMATSSIGNVYAGISAGDVYVQTAGAGAFSALGNPTTGDWKGLTAAGDDMYAALGNQIYKQTNSTGSFVSLAQLAIPYYGLTSTNVWTIPVTDSTYIYSDSTANTYEVWRGNTHVANILLNRVDDLNIYVVNSQITWYIDTHTFLSQDQIFVSGTVTGAKVYRWPNNPILNGVDIKQYSTFKISGGDESDITMVVNVGNLMLISNRSQLAAWNDSSVSYFDIGLGCVSPHGYTKAYGALYFLHYTGIYSTSGGVPTIISSPIKPYLDGATKFGLENASAGKKGRSVFFAIGDVTLYHTDGSVKRGIPDTCLEYDITQQNWYVHTNVPAAAMETFISETNPDRLIFTDKDTKDAKAFLEGDLDDGKEIFFRADTQPIVIAKDFEEIANPQLVIIESERGSSMECFVSIDNEEYYPLEGRAEKGITRLRVHGKDGGVGDPPVGHYIALSFRDSSPQRCKLGRVAVTFMPAGTSNPE